MDASRELNMKFEEGISPFSFSIYVVPTMDLVRDLAIEDR
jgi:hypothetical protein